MPFGTPPTSPHYEGGPIPQSITYRLYGSVPLSTLRLWQDNAAALTDKARSVELERRIEAALHENDRVRWLGDPRVAAVVEHAFLHGSGKAYRLHEWVVMPNHVHVLITPLPGHRLSRIVHGWKSFTARRANRILERRGPFWARDYYDRAIRDDRHLLSVIHYIRHNPVVAGLCDAPEAWRWSSAWGGRGAPVTG